MSSGNSSNNGHAKEAALYEQQQSKIGAVRAALGQLSGKSALYCSDASIARYLVARNWDVKKAAKMLKKTLKWCSEYKPDEIRWDDISEEAVTGKIYRTDYFDKSGRSILVMRPGCQNTKKAKGQVKYLVYCMENAILNLPHGDKNDSRCPTRSLPRKIGCGNSLQCSQVFESFWKMASPLLEQKTCNKVKFVYSDNPDSNKIMEDLFNMDELECAFGGSNQATFQINEYAARMREDDNKMPLFWSPENSALASEPYLMNNHRPQQCSSGLTSEETESGKREDTETASEKRGATETKSEKRGEAEIESGKREETETESGKREETETESGKREETETESGKREETESESEKVGETGPESRTVELTSLPGEGIASADKSGGSSDP